MTKILCTFPGRHGDALWALLTARAIAEAQGAPVDFQIAGEFGSLRPLLAHAPYLQTVVADARWALSPPEEWRAPTLVGIDKRDAPRLADDYTDVIHLGYRGWPDRPLAQFVYDTTRREYPDVPLAPLDLVRPWLDFPEGDRRGWVEGWTDEWFELKVGISTLLNGVAENAHQNLSTNPRWAAEVGIKGCTWEEAARRLSGAQAFVGCNSALHVLACAVGTPVVMVEPSAARHNPIFFPYGQDGPQVTLVKGLDGQPTFDARHAAETLQARLEAIR